ncbi:hypothetical protein [Calothrix sp. 336/3]|uniref:hypothetical protein n=1 Tax=Calothrix sp. 336/3 TaxID=1337936 RepID=UPI000A77852C|nr:hypothetical protein [Calothrix sp. 336/3]
MTGEISQGKGKWEGKGVFLLTVNRQLLPITHNRLNYYKKKSILQNIFHDYTSFSQRDRQFPG